MLKSEISKFFGIKPYQKDRFNCLLRACYVSRLGVLIKQELDINEQFIDKIKAYWDFILFIEEISSPNWTNLLHLENFLKRALLVEKALIEPFVLMCPSYRKDGKPGLNEQIGRTTQVGIRNFGYFVSILNRILKDYAEIKPFADFGVLALEQYNLQNQKQWLDQIEINAQLIQSEIDQTSLGIKLRRTDQIPELVSSIGYEGVVNEDLVDRAFGKSKTVFERNRVFYVDKLGWSVLKSDQRTKNSITTYNTLGHFYSKNYSNPLFFYTANSYEKAVAYNLERQNLFIIYPKKDSEQNIVELR